MTATPPSSNSGRDESDKMSESQPRAASQRRAKGGISLYVLAAAWLLGLGVIYLVQRPQFFDHQIGNIITLILGFIMLVWLLAWFCLQPRIPAEVRVGVPVALIAFVAIFLIVFRIEEVSGELVPKFTFRFAAPADARLEPPPAQGVTVQLHSTSDYDFPSFLGPNRDLKYGAVELADSWKQNPPQLVWRQPIGAGWGGFATVNGYAVTMEQRGDEELTTCYEIATGKPCWSHGRKVRHETLMGGVGPRSTPTLHEGRVYTMGATGILSCLAGETGEVLWERNLLQEFGVSAAEEAGNVSWGRAASPLIVDEKVIVPAGGPEKSPVSLVAYDKLSGEEIWRGGTSQISYSSPALAMIGGVRQVLIVNESSVAGHDLQTGEELWSFPFKGNSNGDATASQAVPLPNDRVLVSKGYGGGAAVYQIEMSAGQWRANEQWRNAGVLKTKFTNAVIVDGNAYALSDGILEGVDWSTGKRLWKKGRYGHGQILLVGDKLLLMAELHLLNIGPRGAVELGEVPAISGKSWNTISMYGRFVLVRNADEAACFRLPIAEGAPLP